MSSVQNNQTPDDYSVLMTELVLPQHTNALGAIAGSGGTCSGISTGAGAGRSIGLGTGRGTMTGGPAARTGAGGNSGTGLPARASLALSSSRTNSRLPTLNTVSMIVAGGAESDF